MGRKKNIEISFNNCSKNPGKKQLFSSIDWGEKSWILQSIAKKIANLLKQPLKKSRMLPKITETKGDFRHSVAEKSSQISLKECTKSANFV